MSTQRSSWVLPRRSGSSEASLNSTPPNGSAFLEPSLVSFSSRCCRVAHMCAPGSEGFVAGWPSAGCASAHAACGHRGEGGLILGSSLPVCPAEWWRDCHPSASLSSFGEQSLHLHIACAYPDGDVAHLLLCYLPIQIFLMKHFLTFWGKHTHASSVLSFFLPSGVCAC